MNPRLYPDYENHNKQIIFLIEPQYFFTYLFGVHVKLLTAHGHLFIPLHIFPLKERVYVVINTNMNIMQNSYTMIMW